MLQVGNKEFQTKWTIFLLNCSLSREIPEEGRHKRKLYIYCNAEQQTSAAKWQDTLWKTVFRFSVAINRTMLPRHWLLWLTICSIFVVKWTFVTNLCKFQRAFCQQDDLSLNKKSVFVSIVVHLSCCTYVNHYIHAYSYCIAIGMA